MEGQDARVWRRIGSHRVVEYLCGYFGESELQQVVPKTRICASVTRTRWKRRVDVLRSYRATECISGEHFASSMRCTVWRSNSPGKHPPSRIPKKLSFAISPLRVRFSLTFEFRQFRGLSSILSHPYVAPSAF